VTVNIVEAFEMINIKNSERKGRTVSPGTLGFFFQALCELAAICQPRQRIGVRQLRQLVLVFFSAADVDMGAYDPDRSSR